MNICDVLNARIELHRSLMSEMPEMLPISAIELIFLKAEMRKVRTVNDDNCNEYRYSGILLKEVLSVKR